MTEKSYIGSKIIKARPMTKFQWLESQGEVIGETVPNDENQAGYQVTYPDGYISWSPKGAFEIAYREITEAEKGLI